MRSTGKQLGCKSAHFFIEWASVSDRPLALRFTLLGSVWLVWARFLDQFLAGTAHGEHDLIGVVGLGGPARLLISSVVKLCLDLS